MALNGINEINQRGTARKSIRYLYGISELSVDSVTFVKVVDYRGRNLSNVTLKANNAGGLFETTTDINGNAEMTLDNPITIEASKYQLISEHNYTGELSVTIILDGKLRE